MANEVKKITLEEALRIIETREPRGVFYLEEGKIFVGIDNAEGGAWTEDFNSLSECLRWINGGEGDGHGMSGCRTSSCPEGVGGSTELF